MNDNYAPKTMAVPKQASVGEKIENIGAEYSLTFSN